MDSAEQISESVGAPTECGNTRPGLEANRRLEGDRLP
jgi:hypothetical protein